MRQVTLHQFFGMIVAQALDGVSALHAIYAGAADLGRNKGMPKLSLTFHCHKPLRPLKSDDSQSGCPLSDEPDRRSDQRSGARGKRKQNKCRGTRPRRQ